MMSILVILQIIKHLFIVFKRIPTFKINHTKEQQKVNDLFLCRTKNERSELKWAE